MKDLNITYLTADALPGYFEKQWEYLCRDLFSEEDTEEDRAYFASEEYRGEVRRRLLDGSLLLLRFAMEGEEIGYAQVLLDRKTARVMEFWVLPPYRGKGLGSACWEETEGKLKSLGVVRVTLEAATDMAEKFWKSKGFATLKQEFMEKALPATGK